MTGYGVQVMRRTESHSFQLDEDELKKVLMNETIKDLPVMVVSVIGPYRSGKSFLLSCFIKYWTSSPTARADGSWLSDNSEYIQGFSVLGGTRLNTTGILLWSEPFITTLPSGGKVAILLMDTEGSFNSISTVRETQTICTLSTLLSSVQIYNVSHTIQEDDIQQLQLIAEYGEYFKNHNGNGTALQMLEFLVRDWNLPWEYDYGSTGGDLLLQQRLQLDMNLPTELRQIRTYIRDSFEKVSGFLMPHPGFKTLNPKYTGKIEDISPEFRTHVVQLTSTIFGPDKLLPKVVNGKRLAATDLFRYFKTYVNLLNSDEIPTPARILKATIDAGLQINEIEELQQYEDNINSNWGEDKPNWVPAMDFSVIHERYKSLALSFFLTKKNISNEFYKLIEDIDKKGDHFMSVNAAKQLKAVESAKAAYDAEIRKATDDGQSFTLQPVEDIHSKAFGEALLVYNASRRRFTTKPDDAIVNLIRILEKKYTSSAVV